MNPQLELLDQIIEMAQAQAKKLNDYNLAHHKALQTIGEDPVVFHLKCLRELMVKDSLVISTKVVLDNREFTVAVGGQKLQSNLPPDVEPFPAGPFVAP